LVVSLAFEDEQLVLMLCAVGGMPIVPAGDAMVVAPVLVCARAAVEVS
jgi:hypothetical protein